MHRLVPGLLAAALAVGAAACAPVDGIPSSAADSNDQLAQLTVAESGAMRGYSRARFPHWRKAGENCDVRDKVLERDGTNVRLKGCDVVGGVWVSRYDSKRLTAPGDVDIDHIVPLANAWRSGADKWDDDKRSDFANDLTRPQLIAVSASSNRSKGDQDPAQWKPPNQASWCQYAQDWIAVKAYWRLTVTIGEKAALTDMLERCRWTSSSPSTSPPAPAG
ncbi:HNH endonuclease family protein [Rhizomonospora bruguierae]|uniref:HNH endonuclease family protein n=1 Tax=Rhizomonospora bruguierae TaxID=1581705 RepID=UPI0035E40445